MQNVFLDGCACICQNASLAIQRLEQVPETPPEISGLKRGLEIAFLVLIVIMIILGLILAFNKLNKSEDEEEEDPSRKTYY